MVIAFAISFALCYKNFNNPTLFGLLIAFMLIESITVFLLITNAYKKLIRSKRVYYTIGAYIALLVIAFVIIFATLKNANSGAEHTFYSIYIVYTLTSLFIITYAVISILTFKKRYTDTLAIASSETVLFEPAAPKPVKHSDKSNKSMPHRKYRKTKRPISKDDKTIERFTDAKFIENTVRMNSYNVMPCVNDGTETDKNIGEDLGKIVCNADDRDRNFSNDMSKSLINDGKVIIELIDNKNTKRNKIKPATNNCMENELRKVVINENTNGYNDAAKLRISKNIKITNNGLSAKNAGIVSKLDNNDNTDSPEKEYLLSDNQNQINLIKNDVKTKDSISNIISYDNYLSVTSEITNCDNNRYDNVNLNTSNGLKEFLEETNVDLLNNNIELSDISIDDIDIDDDAIMSVDAGFDDILAAVEKEIGHNCKPIAIDDYANDSNFPDGVEVIENDFIATGKFADYNVKKETRGKYEEIENENERKISKMTDISKVIITTNCMATIVPIETEILPRTFENKLRMCDSAVKSYYNNIKNKLLSVEGMKSRISKAADTFKYNKEIFSKITISGKTLIVSLNMPTAEYDAKYYKFTDESDKGRYAETPMQIRIKNNLAFKRALEMIDLMLKHKNCNIRQNYAPQDFAANYPYKDNAILYMNSIAHLIKRK